MRHLTAKPAVKTPAIAGLMVAFFVVSASAAEPGDVGNLDHLMSSYQSQGLKIDRLSSEATAFRIRDSVDADAAGKHVSWSGGNGFSIALEEPAADDEAVNANIESLQELSEGAPNLILSWQGEFAEQGSYKVSALGRKLDLKGVHDGVDVDDDAIGWGLQLAGGWRFGDLFAALRVTLGNGIDSLILKRFGSDVAVTESGEAQTLESFSILPSLNYSIGKNSDFRLSVGRYESRDGAAVTGIDTLDTINLGYTWSPWPSAQIGVEVVGKDFEGGISEEDSTEIKIGAEQRF